MNDQSENRLPWCQTTGGFQQRFNGICSKLSLAEYLTLQELDFLCVAAYYAALCNIAFNGLGGCDGVIKPELELHRIGLERSFMIACDRVFRSAGWKSMPKFTKESAMRILLSVSVMEHNLA
jgi:hypothetical protein